MSDGTPSYVSAESSHIRPPNTSNVEHLSETTRDESTSSLPTQTDAFWQRCYGFGKHFFTYVIAEPVYRSALPVASGSEVDSQYHDALTSFGYVDCLRKVRTIAESCGLSVPRQDRPGGSFSQLMELIGRVALHDSPEAKSELAGAIRSSSSAGNRKERHFVGMPPSPPDSVTSDEPETIRHVPRADNAFRPRDAYYADLPREPAYRPKHSGTEVVRRDEPHMGTYATRLHEYCQSRGHGLHHEAEEATQAAATWREVVKINGMTFTGEANTKKAARYKAFRDACIELGI